MYYTFLRITKLVVFNFLRIFSLIVLNLFLIYNQNYYYASSFNKLYEVFVCARTAGSCSYMLISVKQNALCFNVY